VRFSIRTSEYASNALMSGGRLELAVLFKRKNTKAFLWNCPLLYTLFTWNGGGEKFESIRTSLL
jgi:hypothetical protein